MPGATTLDAVFAFAEKAHGDQRRKYTPEPYIVHPVRVMEILKEYTGDECMLAAALLHDVLEDTPVTKTEMLGFLRTVMNENDAKRTLALVIELTDVYIKKDYPALNRRRRKDLERERIAGTSVDAQTIKYADILDNCREIVAHDRHFAGVFLRECAATLRVASNGNQDLYRRTREQVEAAMADLRGAR